MSTLHLLRFQLQFGHRELLQEDLQQATLLPQRCVHDIADTNGLMLKLVRAMDQVGHRPTRDCEKLAERERGRARSLLEFRSPFR